MAKVKLDKFDIKLFKETPEGRAYLEYNDAVGGEPFNPYGVTSVDVQAEYGGVVGLYHECIKQGKTWESLLGTGADYDIMERVK